MAEPPIPLRRLPSVNPMPLLRVDVAGVPVIVRGEGAYEHLTRVNRSLAVAQMALHKIANSHGEIDGPKTAAKAIQDMKERV